MKWTKKGHEFDEIGKPLKDIDTFYIYGCGKAGTALYKKMECLNCVEGFIDADPAKQHEGHLGKTVSPPPPHALPIANSAVIVAIAAPEHQAEALRNMESAGYAKGKNLFVYKEFDWLLPIYAMYKHNKLYHHQFCIPATSVCTLKCEKCFIMNPYIEDRHHRNIDELKRDVVSCFNTFDYLYQLGIGEAEPFTYPNMYEFLEFLISNYIERIGVIAFSSNGCVRLDSRLFDLLRHPKVCIYITNYQDEIKSEALRRCYNENLQQLREHNIRFVESRRECWHDFYSTWVDHNRTEDALIELYCKCDLKNACSYYVNDMIIHCGFSINLGRLKSGIEVPEHLEVGAKGESDKRVILEYMQGFTDRGYLEVCKYCFGFEPERGIKITPGKQLE